MSEQVYITGRYQTPIRLILHDAGPFLRATAEDMGGLLTQARFESQVRKVTGKQPRRTRRTDAGWEAELAK